MATGQPVDRAPALCTAPALAEAAEEGTSPSMLVGVAEVMKTFLRVDQGLLASIGADSAYGLDRLSFQTRAMKRLFKQFPESLLLHRTPSEGGHVLYAFLVESKERVGRVVHLALLKNDTGHSIRKMLTVFKEFNPEWQKVQAVFVDMFFSHKAILHELFPSAQVLLSVYHTVRLLVKIVMAAKISSSLKQSVALALWNAVLSPSAASLGVLSQLVEHVVSPELYNYLRANWFSCELLWSMHGGKGPCSHSAYMDSLDLLTHRICTLFVQQPSLESRILHFLDSAGCLISGVLDSLNWGLLSPEDSWSSLQEKPHPCAGDAAKPSPVSGSHVLPEPTGQAAEVGRGSLQGMHLGSCTDLCSKLCLKEWEVVQASTQLLSPVPGGLAVQLLEDMHWVSQDCRSCTCCFHRRHQLPCRHILAVLQEHGRRVEEAMVCRRWQRRYCHHTPPGCSSPSRAGTSAGSWPESREERVQLLTLELTNLLLQSSGEQLKERSSVLVAILARWARSPGEAAGQEPQCSEER